MCWKLVYADINIKLVKNWKILTNVSNVLKGAFWISYQSLHVLIIMLGVFKGCVFLICLAKGGVEGQSFLAKKDL